MISRSSGTQRPPPIHMETPYEQLLDNHEFGLLPLSHQRFYFTTESLWENYRCRIKLVRPAWDTFISQMSFSDGYPDNTFFHKSLTRISHELCVNFLKVFYCNSLPPVRYDEKCYTMFTKGQQI
jgi:hypothetical protein